MDVDEALLRLGKFNRWRMATYCMVCASVTVPGCWHMMAIVFVGGEPEHRCKIPDGQSLNDTIPLVLKGKKWRYSECLKYVNYSVNNDTMACDQGWHYNDNEFRSSIVTDWDLVCDSNYLVETSQSVFNLGVMVGAIVFTSLADHIGRKPVHLACQYAMLAVGLAIALSPGYFTFIALRFLQGAVREGAGLVGIVMACELFPAVHRTFAGTALELFWAAAWMALSLIAYVIRDWRYLQLAITLPPLVTIALIWLLPESIPWLAANDRIEQADAILRRAAKSPVAQLASTALLRRQSRHQVLAYASQEVATASATKNNNNNSRRFVSGSSVEKGVRALVSRLTGGQPEVVDLTTVTALKTRLSCLDLLKSRKMVLYSFTMCSLWFASGVVYFGLSLSTSNLAGDKHVNFFLSGAVEAPAYALTVVVLQKYGRRWPLFAFHTTTSIVLIITVFIPTETESGVDLSALNVTLTMIGKFAMTAAFGTVVLYATEIYPTNLRNFGFGLASVFGRIGGMIAPFFAYIGKTGGWMQTVVFSVLALVTGAMALFLPETLNRPLPETIDEIEAWTLSGRPRGPRSTGDGSAAVDPPAVESDLEKVPIPVIATQDCEKKVTVAADTSTETEL